MHERSDVRRLRTPRRARVDALRDAVAPDAAATTRDADATASPAGATTPTGAVAPARGDGGDARHGETPALDVRAAFAEHGSAMLGFAVNALRDRALAEDCVQETFLRAWRARETFDARRGSTRTWLFAIERRVVLDALRARARRPRIVPEDDAPEPVAAVVDPLDRLGVVEALARLPEPQRAAIVAVHMLGRTHAEHAEAVGVPVGTVRTRTFYALRALRAQLDEVEWGR